jgi:trans-aconitate 2-methyltransferase
MSWDPDRYHRFRAERRAPFLDLLPLIAVREGLRVVDLGCGTGELTAELVERLPGSDVLGIDTSAQMLEQAAPRARDRLRFARGAIEELAGEWDLIFSNAALHWVEDHARLLPRLCELLCPGGQLVVQLPANHDHAAHRLVVEVAGEEPFRGALGGWVRRTPVLPLADYAELLFAAGGRQLTAIEKVYPHLLDNADAIADWARGTTLLPYLERLPDELHEPYFERYRARLRARYPGRPVFYGFRRILLAATR